MKFLLPLFFLLVLTPACHKREKINVLPPAEMKTLLWDFMRADEMAETFSLKDSSWRGLDRHAQTYQQILSIHHTTREAFRKSLHYYESNPDQLKPILDSLQVMAEHAQRQDENYGQSPSPVKSTADSSPSKKYLDSFRKKRISLRKP